MIDIEILRKYYADDMVLISDHAAQRFQDRGIKAESVKNAVNNGKIIEQYPDDYPFPSCLVLGHDSDGKAMHAVLSDEGSMSRIITAYYPDPSKWNDDFTERKD